MSFSFFRIPQAGFSIQEHIATQAAEMKNSELYP